MKIKKWYYEWDTSKDFGHPIHRIDYIPFIVGWTYFWVCALGVLWMIYEAIKAN